MYTNTKTKTLSIDIENYKFEYNFQNEKDIVLYKKSTVNIEKYIFVETIRLFQADIKYMINNENLNIFAKSWYEKYICKDY